MTISIKRLYREYPYELSIISAAVIVAFLSLLAMLITASATENTKVIQVPHSSSAPSLTGVITVDVSGSVNNPDVYTFTHSPRIKEVIEKAGGLTSEADLHFIYRNFNMARFVSDQEKIYIPSFLEIQTGTFTEDPRTLQYLAPVKTGVSAPTSSSSSSLIHINTASAEQLDTLDGIGATLSKSIIDHRPYKDINELVSKKVLKQTVFSKIKDKISL